jgi:hypothetical protein
MSLKLCSMNVLLLALLLLFGTCGEAAQHSMKGYELYSWRTNGDWYFSLLMGTNRLKTREEISAPKNRLSSVRALKEKLQQLPKGEEVIW